MSDVERAFLTDLAHSILAIKADAKFSIEGEDADKITWYDDNPSSITKADILAKQTELQTDYDNKEYQSDRKAEYPSLQDCIHALLDGGDTLTDLQALRQAVKDKYPKG